MFFCICKISDNTIIALLIYQTNTVIPTNTVKLLNSLTEILQAFQKVP